MGHGGTVIEERKAEDGTAVSFVIKFNNGRTTIRHKSHMRFAIKKNEESEKVRSLSWSETVNFSDGETGSLDRERKVRPVTYSKLKREKEFKTRWGSLSD